MKLQLTEEQRAKLTEYLTTDSDCEQLTATEYVADFYDLEKPVTVNVVIKPNGSVFIDAAAELLYDEEEEAWYMGEQIESAAEVLAFLAEAGAI